MIFSHFEWIVLQLHSSFRFLRLGLLLKQLYKLPNGYVSKGLLLISFSQSDSVIFNLFFANNSNVIETV